MGVADEIAEIEAVIAIDKVDALIAPVSIDQRVGKRSVLP
jgi:hypothetical protein